MSNCKTVGRLKIIFASNRFLFQVLQQTIEVRKILLFSNIGVNIVPDCSRVNLRVAAKMKKGKEKESRSNQVFAHKQFLKGCSNQEFYILSFRQK
jgi:hypothetical protein